MVHDGLPSTVVTPPAVTLTFDLLTPKANQHMYEPKYILPKLDEVNEHHQIVDKIIIKRKCR